MKHTIAVLLTALLLILTITAAAAEEQPDAADFRAVPGITSYLLMPEKESFMIETPWEWDADEYTGVYGVPTLMTMSDMDHIVLVSEIDPEQQREIEQNPRHMLYSFLGEGKSVLSGQNTDESRILENFDLYGLRAVRVDMIGQGYEMVWISDGECVWFFMYPTHPEDEAYTAVVKGIVDSFTLLHPTVFAEADAGDFAWTAGDDGIHITKWLGDAVYVHIPAEIDGKPVVSVEDSAFYEADVRGVTFPDSVNALGSYVFGGCTQLVSVTLPASLRILPEGAFESCVRLLAVRLNEGLERIEKAAFWGNSSLFELALPDSLLEIEEPNLVAMPSLSWFDVSERCAGFVTQNDDQVLLSRDGKRLLRYTNADGEERFAVPDGVETIDQSAFYAAYSLETVILPESLRSIGALAFALSSVEELYIPAGVTEIGVLTGSSDDNGNPAAGRASIGTVKTVRGYPGTAAEEYAKQFNMTFIPMTGE